MRKKYKIIIVCVLCMFLASSVYARGEKGDGQGMRGGMKWWKNSEVVEKLALTPEQVQKIDAISKARKKDSIKMRSEMDILKVDFDAAMEIDKIDMAHIQSLIDKMVSYKSKMQQQRMETLLKIRNELTKEQYLKLKALRGEKRGMKKGGQKRMQNQQNKN